ncbi:MAG TPA: 4-hydroxyphenylacetate 3-hydroxylase N-terminal domain-containing protein [Candidatus Binataceae bacterium]|nr:4-hydroxyphenylacetate 3-hydroxylase N-terminal domain-containing protein [Candidatus Binataceae bacterium]
MGVRSGREYIDSLRDDRELYINGELVRDVTNYAPMRGVIDEIAALYDRQHENRFAGTLTYRSPSSGDPVSTSFLMPETYDDVERRLGGERMRVELTNGMMGRLPDYMNAYVTDLAAVKRLLGRNQAAFGEHAVKYYELVRERDLALTHTLVDPQIDRSKGIEAQEGLRIVRETDAGIVVTGARMLSTLAPISNEILVAPYMPRRAGEERFAMVFAVPVATRGLSFVCREPYDLGRSTYDRPLSSRYDEGDAIAIFRDVLVPWERVFAAGDPETYNLISPTIPGFLLLQAAVRGVVKLRFMTGVANLVAEAVGRSAMARYQEMLGGLVANVELAEGLLSSVAREIWNNLLETRADGGGAGAEMTAQGASKFIPGVGTMFGVTGRTLIGLTMVRIFLPNAHTQVVDGIRMMGSSGLIMTPTEKDLANPKIGAVINQYLRGASISAAERVRVMKLAWDAIGEPFGSRSLLYEWFFAGDPINNRILYFGTETNAACTAMARQFLERPAPRG